MYILGAVTQPISNRCPLCLAGTSFASSIGVQQVTQILHSQLQTITEGTATSAASTEAVSLAAAAQAATGEAETAGAPAVSSKDPWQSAVEKCFVHAVILQDLCQQHSAVADQTAEHAGSLAEQSVGHSSHSASAQTQSSGSSSSSQQTSLGTDQISATADHGQKTTAQSPASLDSDIQFAFSRAPAPLQAPAPPPDSPRTPQILSDAPTSSDTATAARRSSSGVRSAAHRRLANPNKQQLWQELGQQHDAETFQAVLQAAPAVLQDMAVNIAEAVGLCYLAQARSGLQGMCSIL